MPFDWDGAVETLRRRVGEEVAGRWIAPLKMLSVSDASLVLEAPNPYFQQWVVSHYQESIREAAGGRAVRIQVASSDEARERRVDGAAGEERRAEPRRSEARVRAEDHDEGLNRKCTFEHFVVGPSNRFAHAASMAVAESPAKAYTPLFIYGGVGLGKTHLMQAIGWAMIGAGRANRVTYVSSEQFTNELITAIQTKTTARFRERYRHVGALLIDDIQFIAGKESTQEEFFHTFNALYDAHKQIVLSSDRPPKEIAGLEERLVSRFEWGLVTDIQSPDLETRIAILRQKAKEARVEVPDDVTLFIAGQITANIRELEGALIRVVAYSRFFAKPLAVEVAREVLKDMVREVSARVTVDLIQQRVSGYFRMSPEELKSARRQRSILYPRQVAMFLCRSLTDASLPEIGRAFGGRDHTTVMHAVEKITQELAQDSHKKRVVDHLTQLITTTTNSTS
jgi:chromosomal replication initiator protein